MADLTIKPASLETSNVANDALSTSGRSHNFAATLSIPNEASVDYTQLMIEMSELFHQMKLVDRDFKKDSIEQIKATAADTSGVMRKGAYTLVGIAIGSGICGFGGAFVPNGSAGNVLFTVPYFGNEINEKVASDAIKAGLGKAASKEALSYGQTFSQTLNQSTTTTLQNNLDLEKNNRDEFTSNSRENGEKAKKLADTLDQLLEKAMRTKKNLGGIQG